MERVKREYLRALINEMVVQSVHIKNALFRDEMDIMIEMAVRMSRAFEEDKKLFIFGNGGSAADAQHMAAEFVNRFKMDRSALPAMALTVNTSVITSIANDSSFDEVFVRQLQAFAGPGDVALGISTSGRSKNVVDALKWARDNGLHTLGWTGKAPTSMDPYCHLIVHVPCAETPRIQEMHITVGHVLCDLVERLLYPTGRKK